MLLDWEKRLYVPQKSTYTSLSLDIVDVIYLSLFTILVDLLLTHGVPILCRTLLACQVAIIKKTTSFTIWVVLKGSIASVLNALELSESMKTLARSYSLPADPRSMLSTSFKALTTFALLIWASFWYQIWIYLFWLIRYMSYLRLLIAIAFTDIA